jgi:integrase/recombinase XerD
VSPPHLQLRRALTRPRKQLPFENWPMADQEAWEGLFQEGDLLDDAGAAQHWSAATRFTNLKHYARWLGWWAAEGRLGQDASTILSPSDRATPETVKAYARALMAEGVARRTVASSLIGLKCVLQRMAPDEDWAWLKAMTNRLDGWAMPSRVARVPEQSGPELFAIALGQLERLSRIPAPKARHRQAYRDVLLVALLLACPVRERNLAMMEVDRHLVRIGDEWHLRFEPQETKTGQALHLIAPAELTRFLDDYLARIRPGFPGAAAHVHVWPAQKGRPMAEETIYASVMATSARLFGTALNPHAFRSLSATLLAETSPEDALRARPLLGHRQMGTTQKHYIRASQLSAARKVAAAVQEIRDNE